MKTEGQIRDHISELKKEATNKGKPKPNKKKIKELVELIKIVKVIPEEKIKHERQKLIDQVTKVENFFLNTSKISIDSEGLTLKIMKMMFEKYSTKN